MNIVILIRFSKNIAAIFYFVLIRKQIRFSLIELNIYLFEKLPFIYEILLTDRS